MLEFPYPFYLLTGGGQGHNLHRFRQAIGIAEKVPAKM